MVILSKEVENVLDRIFLVGVTYDGTIPPLYTKAKSAISNLDKTVHKCICIICKSCTLCVEKR